MTLGERLHTLRNEIGLSQEAVGAQGFVSAPGWIKIENGQRQPSEKLIESLLKWLVSDKHVKATNVKGLREELLTLKYMGSNSAFLKGLAKDHAKTLPNGTALVAPSNLPPRRRGRPRKVAK